MQTLSLLVARHHTKLWAAAVLILAVLTLNLGASPRLEPGQWQYKTVVFKIEQGDPVASLQAQFDGVLNRESEAGWEFVGPCARLSDDHFGIDYIVLRRRVQ